MTYSVACRTRKRSRRRWFDLMALCAVTLGAIRPVAGAPAIRPAESVAAQRQQLSVVLEANVGERTAHDGELMAPLFSALEGYGFSVRPPAIAQLLRGRLPRPGILDTGKTTEDIVQQINVGIDAFNRGRFKEAEEALTLGIRLVKRNPALLVLDATNSKVTFDAFVELALAEVKLGHNTEAVETITELIRMTSTPVSRTAYGPQAEQFYRSVLKQVQSTGRGSLAINVNDPRAVVFLDGEYRGIGKVLLGDLIPGRHQAFVQVPGTSSRQYDVEIQADAQAMLDIDWRIDSALTVDELRAGFVFASELERAKEAAYAQGLVRQWGNVDVTVVGTIRLGGTPCVIGTVYHPGGKGPRGAFVPLSDGVRGLQSLARFLYDGTVSGTLSVVSRPDGTAQRESDRSSHHHLVTAPQILMATGLITAATAGGAYAKVRNDDQGSTDSTKRVLTVGALATGSALAGGGVYLWLRETRTADALPSAMVGTGVAGVVAGTVSYLLNENPSPMHRYYTNGKTPGLIVGGSGLALTGAGLWLVYRSRSGTTAASAATAGGSGTAVRALPVISLDSSHALIEWAGTF